MTEKLTTRKRRTPEQIIVDLQAKIRDVKARAKREKLNRSPAIKKSTATIRMLDKSIDLAHTEGHARLHHALTESRQILVEALQKEGLCFAKTRKPRGPKPNDN